MSEKNKTFDRANRIVNSWPKWKKEWLATKYSSNAALLKQIKSNYQTNRQQPRDY